MYYFCHFIAVGLEMSDGHYVPVYLINLGTQNFFGTIILGTRHISAA
jgi:hypothetical protein